MEVALVPELGSHFRHTLAPSGFLGERSEGHMKGMSKLRVWTQECQEEL